MKALIYKDLESIKKALVLMSIIILGISIGFFLENKLFLAPLFFILIPVIVLGMVFGIDSQSNFDKYIIACGMERFKIVLSRYILVWFMALIGILVGILVGFSQNSILTYIPLALFLSIILFTSTIVAAIQLPLMYKFGEQKARMIFVLIYFIIFGLFSTISSNRETLIKFLSKGLEIDKALLAFLILLVTIFINLISFYISFRIYKNKEF